MPFTTVDLILSVICLFSYFTTLYRLLRMLSME